MATSSLSLASLTEAQILALTLMGEARGEPLAGLVAVANVVTNRVKAGRWRPTVRGVCLQPKQFSCWNEGDPNRTLLLAWAAAVARHETPHARWPEVLAVAQLACEGLLADPTHGACHYHAVSMAEPPRWATGAAPSATVGHHVFYAGVA